MFENNTHRHTVPESLLLYQCQFLSLLLIYTLVMCVMERRLVQWICVSLKKLYVSRYLINLRTFRQWNNLYILQICIVLIVSKNVIDWWLGSIFGTERMLGRRKAESEEFWEMQRKARWICHVERRFWHVSESK